MPALPGRVPHVRLGVHGPKKTGRSPGRSPFERFYSAGKTLLVRARVPRACRFAKGEIALGIAVLWHLLWYLSMKSYCRKPRKRASRYLTEINTRRVAPSSEDVARLQALGGPLPQGPSDPSPSVGLARRHRFTGDRSHRRWPLFRIRHRGFAAAALAANWLAGAWDQNSAMQVMYPRRPPPPGLGTRQISVLFNIAIVDPL